MKFKKIRGFTLIELLVVIAIIGILAALLLPVLNKAKNHASKVTDLNNLKQIMVAVNLYCADNADVLPLPNWDGGATLADGQYHAGWLYKTDPAKSGPDQFNIEAGLLWPILKERRIYVCPMDKTDKAHSSSLFGGVVKRAQQLSTYGMNGAVTGYMHGSNHPEVPAQKLASFHPDDCAFWETDETEPFYFNDGANYPHEGVSGRHLQGGIQATFSGTVNYVRLEVWYKEVDDPVRNRLWCYPEDRCGGDPDTGEHSCP